MQDDFRFVVTLLAIFAGTLMRHSGMKGLRAELQRVEDRLVGRLDRIAVDSRQVQNPDSQSSFGKRR